jgi:hypothetical protein
MARTRATNTPQQRARKPRPATASPRRQQRRIVISVICVVRPRGRAALPNVGAWGRWLPERRAAGTGGTRGRPRPRDLGLIRICCCCTAATAMRTIERFLTECRPQLLALAKARCQATVDLLFALYPDAAAQGVVVPDRTLKALAAASTALELTCCRATGAPDAPGAADAPVGRR